MKDKIIKRIRECAEYKQFKENTVLLQMPYGIGKDSFLLPCLISKEAFEQIKIYDDIYNKAIEEEKLKEEKSKEEINNISN